MRSIPVHYHPANESESGCGGLSQNTQGVVVSHFGVAVAVRLENGDIRRVSVRRNSSHVVGDRVELEGERLTSLPASGVLRRRDSHGRVRAVAANLDVLGVVLAPIPVSPGGFVDRAIVAARAAGIEPVIVVNKADLPGAQALFEEMARHHALPEGPFLVSAALGSGLGTLRRFFAEGRRGAFVGTSGVGKSSLLNTLCPELDLDVGEINEVSGLGRHVTSVATLHALSDGGELIDTPGFRDFGPVEVSAEELAAGFPGFAEELESRCRFRDCRHRSEPGCRVREAVEAGRIPTVRYTAYLDLLDELEELERAPRSR
jgi:ribosome biogenesis GTPase